MSQDNGVIRVGRKGLKKFAFGDGKPFEIDVIVVIQEWFIIDESFRDKHDDRNIPVAELPGYHSAAVDYVQQMCGESITTAEALDFLARLREEYEKLANFFVPNLSQEQDERATSGEELRFSVEEI